MKTLKYVILGLAAARLTQLVVDDEITSPIRDTVQELATDGGPKMGAWDKLDTAINCHACTSIWAGGGVLVAEHAGPLGRFLVRTLALSQAALSVKAAIDFVERK